MRLAGPIEFSNLHYIGFFVPDLRGGAEELLAARCQLQPAARDGDASPTIFPYFRDSLGIRVELVDAAMPDGIEQFLCVAPTGAN